MTSKMAFAVVLLLCQLTVVGSAATNTTGTALTRSSTPSITIAKSLPTTKPSAATVKSSTTIKPPATTAKSSTTRKPPITTAKTSTTTDAPTTTTTIDYYAYVIYPEEEEPVDPDKTAYGVMIGVSGAACILLLYMALFGQRMRRTAIRWHIINCSWWSILHLVSYGSSAEKAPWPNFIISEDWRDSYKEVECFTRSIFPFGMIFVYFEAMIRTCAPSLSDNWIFNMIFFLLLIPYLNIIAMFCFFAKWMEVEWFYPPVEFLNLFTYVIFCLVTLVYLIFCLIQSGFCCFVIFSRNNHKRTVYTFIDMWLLFPYGLIPAIMYGPSFGFTSLEFVRKFLLKWLMENGFVGGVGEGGEFMQTMMKVAEYALTAMPWFVLLVPLAQVLLAVICIEMFREQFFFAFSCGRFYEGPALPEHEKSKRWASPAASRSDYPSVERVKMKSEREKVA
ncbi:hypothetical protein V3C99_009507 [Haemonchus contortus]